MSRVDRNATASFFQDCVQALLDSGLDQATAETRAQAELCTFIRACHTVPVVHMPAPVVNLA